MIITDNYAKCMSAADRKKFKVLLPAERIAKLERQSEKELQRIIENWLTLQGLRRRTPSEILRPGKCRGWFIHLNKTKKNPIILDLLILFNGKYIEVELKTAEGRISAEQDALIACGGKICRTLADFERLFADFYEA